MKFLTMESWIAGQDLDSDRDPRAPLYAYKAYLASVREKLPAGCLRFMESVYLHDGRLVNLNIDVPNRAVTLVVDAFGAAENFVRVAISYRSVHSFSIPYDPVLGFSTPVSAILVRMSSRFLKPGLNIGSCSAVASSSPSKLPTWHSS
jgi:hypothetical protein